MTPIFPDTNPLPVFSKVSVRESLATFISPVAMKVARSGMDAWPVKELVPCVAAEDKGRATQSERIANAVKTACTKPITAKTSLELRVKFLLVKTLKLREIVAHKIRHRYFRGFLKGGN